MQSRRWSVVEAAANVGAGMVLSLSIQVVWFPHKGIHLSWGDNVDLMLTFTAASFLRSYALRRFFTVLGRRK